MANIYATANNCSSSSSPVEPDDISFFLQKFLLPSSSSSTLMQQHSVAVSSEYVTSPLPGSGRIPLLESSSGGIFPSSSSVGTADTDADALEYDCESEEAIEAMAEEAPPKPTPPRSSSKRTRAAEVHNLSEKRRRSRINEKMKALQNLIPNSNKTDKASMLDEAIEYLKQLQLQVQMLTMRNGLSLYPLSVAGVPQPDQISEMRMGINYPGNGPLNVNMESEHRLTQGYISNALFSLPGNSVTHTSAADFSKMMGLKASFELESLPTHHGPLQFARGSSVPFDARPSDLNDNTLEACFIRGERLGDEQQTNLGHNPNLLPQFNSFAPLLSTQIGERVSNDDIKIETNKS